MALLARLSPGHNCFIEIQPQLRRSLCNPASIMDPLAIASPRQTALLLAMYIHRVQATQRAGRAGRTRDGRCYRLYTQKYFERDMPAETLPEIQRTSMLTAVLFLKSLPLDIDVLAFDYLDHPGVSLPGLCFR